MCFYYSRSSPHVAQSGLIFKHQAFAVVSTPFHSVADSPQQHFPLLIFGAVMYMRRIIAQRVVFLIRLPNKYLKKYRIRLMYKKKSLNHRPTRYSVISQIIKELRDQGFVLYNKKTRENEIK